MAYSHLARRIKFLIASWRRHGTRHVREVFRQDRRRRRYARSPIGEPDIASFKQHFHSTAEDAVFAEEVHRFVARRLPVSRANRKDLFLDLLQKSLSHDQILDDAEHVAEGRFSALGICINETSARFDWHRDYSSLKRWPPEEKFNAISFMGGDGADVKYVWELSRGYWIGWLGGAYWLTGNSAWSGDFLRTINAWRADNPVNVGVNWAMPMEVGIRGFWLVMGYAIFWGAPNISSEWWVGYLRSVWSHGTYLANNLEYFSNLTNHYITNCFGLVALGAMFADTTEGGTWLREGRRRMIEELEHQVLPDGVHYERSIGYHRLVLEMYLIALVFLERSGLPFPSDARAKVERMAEFTDAYTTPLGTAPQFGDSDDGVILRLSTNQDLYDHRDTLSLAAAIFERGDFAERAGGYHAAALWIVGVEGFEKMRGLRAGAPKVSAIFPHGGFAVLRNRSFHVVADCGEIGLHGNNDTLSFTLSTAETDIIVDPGTYCYTRDSARRDELRSTTAHNTPVVDGRELAEFDGLWRIREDRTAPRIERWEVTEASEPGTSLTPDQRTILEASHSAWSDPQHGGVVVHRRWELEGDRLRVTDRIEGPPEGKRHVVVRFTIPGELRVVQHDERRIEIEGNGAEQVELTSSHPITLQPGWYSPSYGVALAATFVVMETTIQGSAREEIAYICRLLPII
jgi:hypothetical protein